MKYNIYELYTDNVGTLTPMIADQLKLDEDEYGTEAVEDAIRIAVFRNARNMKYIEAVLRNRSVGGMPRDSRDTPSARARYAEWEGK